MLTNDNTKGICRILTSNPAMAGRKPRQFSTLEEVSATFGKGSAEYRVAKNFFDLVNLSTLKNIGIQFGSWGYGGSSPWELYSAEGSGKTGFTVTNLVDETTFNTNSIYNLFKTIGNRAMVSLKLTGDTIYVSQETAADTERMAALKESCGENNIITTDDTTLLNGFVVGEEQVLLVDLNGHKISGDLCGIINKGFTTINDSVGTGCVFTTNWEKMIGDASHSSRFEKSATVNRATTEAVRNEGSMIINGGWFGTDHPTKSPRVNEVNWGQCLACHGSSTTIVNGGHFTTVTWHNNNKGIVPKLAADVGQDSWLAKREYLKTEGWNYSPYAAIIDTYDTSQIIWNYGECYGLYNDVFEVKGDGTTVTNYGGIEIYDGKFYIGFPNFVFVPGGSSIFGMQSMLQASAASNQFLPSEYEAGSEGWSPIIVYNGEFYDNSSLYNEDGGKGRISPPKRQDPSYPGLALNFSGRVSIRGGYYNFQFSKEFRDFTSPFEFRGLKKIVLTETISQNIETLFEDKEDLLTFGVFGYLEGVTEADSKKIPPRLLADKYNHIFCETGTDKVVGDGIAIMKSLEDGLGELCRAFQPLAEKIGGVL